MAEVSAHSKEPSFGERLQQITELLAAASSEARVFEAVLRPALEALGGLAGLIMLVQGDELKVMARHGYDPAAQLIWQDGPLEAHTPATDVFRDRQPLFFERSGELTAAYPQLEAQTGGAAAVASAVLPIALEAQVLGVLVLDFREPHSFTPDERRFLRTLAGQCAIALDRIRVLTQEQAARQALEASEQRFRRLVMASPTPAAVGRLDGSLLLVNDAYLKLLGFTRAEFEAGEINWLNLNRPEDLAQDEAMFAVTFAQGASPAYQKVMFTKTGEVRHLRVRLLRYEEEGELLVFGYLEDLTEQLATHQSLQWQNDVLEERVLERTAELEARTAALDAFVAYTEAVGSETEVRALTQQATRVIQANLAHASTAYYELDGALWRAKLWSGDLLPEIVAQIEAGVPLDAPNFAEARQVAEPYFVDGFSAEANGVDAARSFGAVAFVPLLEDGQVRGLFTVGIQAARAWQERERTLIRVVGRGLTLSLERAEGARQLARQNTELMARTQALEAFAQLTTDLSVQQDPYALVKRAQEVALSLLPTGYALYLEPDGERWRNRVQTGDERNAALKAFNEAGPPRGQLPSMDRPWATGEALYQDHYAKGADTPPEMVQHINAAATLPVVVAGERVGLMVVPLFEQHTWTPADKMVLDSVVRSLGTALERSVGARQLAQQNAELAVRTRALEAFAELTGDLSVQQDTYALVRRAQELVLSLLSAGYALYYEREGERWRNRVQTGDVGNAELQNFIDAGPLVSETPSVDVPWDTQTPLYQDTYAKGSDTPLDIVQHVNAAASLPVVIGGETVGMFITVLFEQRTWTHTDRVMLETVARSLELALERARDLAQLAARTAELERAVGALSAANEELEAFTYSVSHDLMTPVRHVASFSQLAGQSLDDQTKTRRYLGIIGQGAQRMNTLIEAMLQLSRTGRKELRWGMVDLGALVDRARQDLAAETEGRAVEWHVEPLPLVTGDRDTLQQTVSALLDNAVKYTRPREQASVHIWTEEGAHDWTVFVQDNGVGFDPRYTDKLFGIFQRLHRQEEFEGVGVGLANVRRIVTRHGGTVHAEGGVDLGATFSFTLPKRD